MYSKVLVVKAEPQFKTRLKDRLTRHNNRFDFTFAADRRQGIQALQHTAFNTVVTGLKIPRISDGYLFLNHIIKTVAPKKILVVSDENSAQMRNSVGLLGINNVVDAANTHGIFSFLEERSGPDTQIPSEAAGKPDLSGLTTHQIQTALNWVMGPVGTLLYEEVKHRLKSPDNMAELVTAIALEIGEQAKIDLFYKKLDKS